MHAEHGPIHEHLHTDDLSNLAQPHLQQMQRHRGGGAPGHGHGHQQHRAHGGRRPQHHGPHGDGKDREIDSEPAEISAAEQEALRAAVLAGFRMPEREKGVSARGRRRPAPRDADKRLISEDQYTQARCGDCWLAVREVLTLRAGWECEVTASASS